MSGTLLILNAKIVNEDEIIESDIYIRRGRIEKIAQDLSSMKVLNILDLKGKYLLPGMIDADVHFREPGMPEKGSISSESKAAVAGGVTTFFDMPNTIPAVSTIEILEDKMKRAVDSSIANFSFYQGATATNLDEIKAIDPSSCCGLKVSMGGTRGDMLVDEERLLQEIFEHAPLLIATHCEDTPTIVENEENYRQIYGDDTPFELHSKIRSEDACYQSSSLAIALAEKYQTRLHILQISTEKEVELFSQLPLSEKLITAEVAIHYLDFSDEDYEKKGALIKCDPAIKTEVDRAALFQGLMDGNLDTIASGHAPHTWDEKQGNYFDALSGIPSVQYVLPSLLEHVQDGILSLENIVRNTSHSVADIFQIKERGYIREGYWADFVIIDLESPFTVDRKTVLSKCSWTPYEGHEFRSSVYATIVNGDLVYINNKIRSGSHGKRVEFDRES